MAVPSEGAWVDGDPLDTTNLNAQVRDALTWLMEPPAAHLRQTAVQTNLANNTFTSITFTVGEDLDSQDGHSPTTNTSRYTAHEDGWWMLTGGVSVEANATGRRMTQWAKNGTVVSGSRIDTLALSAGESVIPARTIFISLSAGDYVELQLWQNSGGTRSTVVLPAEQQSTLTALWIRRL